MKNILTIVSISLLTLSIGCSKAGNNQTQTPTVTQKPSSSSPSPAGTTGIKQDQDLTKKLTGEKIVSGGQVYLQGDNAIAVMIIKKGTSEKTAKDLAQTYADILKQKYSGKMINVQAVLEGKSVANIIYNKK